MKITIQPSEPQDDIPADHQQATVTVETRAEDLTAAAALALAKAALAAYGYHPDNLE